MTPAFMSGPASVEEVKSSDRRGAISAMVKSLGIDELTPEDLRLIAHMRVLKYGSLTVSVVNGIPTRATDVQLHVDYTKTLDSP